MRPSLAFFSAERHPRLRTSGRAHQRRRQAAAARPAPGALAALPLALVVALSLPAWADAGKRAHSRSKPSNRPTLPRHALISLKAVRVVLPEMVRETAAGANRTAIGHPTGTGRVTYATASGSQRVVISVDRYRSAGAASSAYQQALRKSEEVPGASSGEVVSGLGDQAFIGVVTQGDETHVGGGALYGDLIVTVTLQGYNGTKAYKDKVAELIRKQAALVRSAP